MVDGPVGLDVEYSERRDGRAAVAVAADLSGAALAVPLGWSKPAGPPAEARATLLLDHGHLRGVESLRATAPGLALRGRAEAESGRATVLRVEQAAIGRTEASGIVRFPQRQGGAIRASVTGARLDLSSQFGAGPERAAGGAAAPPAPPAAPTGALPGPLPGANGPAGTPWVLDARFDRVLLARGRSIAPVTAHLEDDGRRIDAAQLRAGEGAGALLLTMSPQPVQGRPATHASPAAAAPAIASGSGASGGGASGGGASAGAAPGSGMVRRVALQTADAGALLSSLDVTDAMRGGRLTLGGTLEDGPGQPFTGTLRLRDLNLTDAPAAGRLLEGMTVYGIVDLMHGPGLYLSQVDVPFRMADQVVTLGGARAFNASLGATASGRVDLAARSIDVSGTVVPAYFFNQLPGRLPLVGWLFSPERGGGVFAATYTVKGPLDGPKVRVNPMAALAPGFVRKLLGLP